MNLSMQVVAEKYLRKYYTPKQEDITAMCLLFMQDVCNWSPRGIHQIFWMDATLHNKDVMCVAPPRTGKTMGIEAVDLYEVVMYPNEDFRVYAPKLGQCVETLSYHYDWISQSSLLKSYLNTKNGKPIFSSVNYKFANGSNAMCYSIRGELEGHNMSIARVEEFDDWPWEIFADALPRRWGAASKNERGKRVRITGTIMGQENIYKVMTDPELSKMFLDLSQHPVLGILDVYAMLAIGGVLDESAVAKQKALMSSDEWARSMLLKCTEAKNFIRRKYIRAGLKKSNQWGLEGVPYKIGDRYEKPVGATVAAGLDCGDAGQGQNASVYSLTFTEEMDMGGRRYIRWLNTFEWDPKTAPTTLQKEICDLLEYYQADGGYGDALQMILISNINRECYRRHISSIDPDEFPENTPGNWDKQFIIPVRNNDAFKHEMYTAIQLGIEQYYLFFPYYDRKDDCHEAMILRLLLQQLEGIKKGETKGQYPSYHAESKRLGDDHGDSLGMSMVWQNKHLSELIDYTIAQGSISGGRVMSGSSILNMLKGWGR